MSGPAGTGIHLPAATCPAVRHNRDVAWDSFDTGSYVADNYATLHDFDRRIISELSDYYRALPCGGLERSVDVGTGPNLYPLMLVAAASQHLEVLERSAANAAYLRRACLQGAGVNWTAFWQLCRQLNPALPADLDHVLRHVTVRSGDALELPVKRYDLVSMFFMAESVTGDRGEFEQFCHSFTRAAVPGGHLVAAFMAGMPEYELGGQVLPSYALDKSTLEAVMDPVAQDLRVWQLPADPTLPYRHEGVLLLTARARS